VSIPTCGSSPDQGACTNEDDCPLVDTGAPVQTQACLDCYAGIAECTQSACAKDCAEDLAGNGCLVCQTEAGCHTEFMECSGLNFMPWNSVEFAEW